MTDYDRTRTTPRLSAARLCGRPNMRQRTKNETHNPRHLADVIDIAINKYLWDGLGDRPKKPAESYSCPAVDRADRSATTEIKNFLQSMGMNPIGLREFNAVPYGPKRQYARALWLTWAAMIAREEGEVL